MSYLFSTLKILAIVSRLFRFLRNETVLFWLQGWTIYIEAIASNQKKTRNWQRKDGVLSIKPKFLELSKWGQMLKKREPENPKLLNFRNVNHSTENFGNCKTEIPIKIFSKIWLNLYDVFHFSGNSGRYCSIRKGNFESFNPELLFEWKAPLF